MKKLTILLTLATLTCPILTFGSESLITLPGDTRKVRNVSAPKWLEAVGKLETKISATKGEMCSLTLLANDPSKDGIIVVTAGHCIDHWASYHGGFDVEENTVTFKSNRGRIIKRKIVEILKGETHKGDYAIAKLDAYIAKSDIEPLINSPYDYTDMMDDDTFGQKFKPFATMAGYSADKGLGQSGKVLTYDEDCQLNGGGSGLKKGYCYSYGGASGGPVAVTVDITEYADEIWQEGRRTYFVGSIVGSRLGDDNSKTMFTDTTYYTSILDPILYNH